MLSTLTFTKPPYIAYCQMSYVLAPGALLARVANSEQRIAPPRKPQRSFWGRLFGL
jgi:hypothetical protein